MKPQKLYRTLHLNVYTSDYKGYETFILKPPIGKLWTKEHLHIEMSKFVHQLKHTFPGNEFQAIRTKPNRYNLKPLPICGHA